MFLRLQIQCIFLYFSDLFVLHIFLGYGTDLFASERLTGCICISYCVLKNNAKHFNGFYIA